MCEDPSVDLAAVIERYDNDTDMLIPMMQDVQEVCGYLPQPELRELSGRLQIPLTRIYSVASFYKSFRLMPKCDHTIELCMGTVCFLKGADKIGQAIQQEFNIEPGGTSPDRKFSYTPANCIGACALAPVMIVDGEYHGGLTVESAVNLLQEIAAADNPAPASAES